MDHRYHHLVVEWCCAQEGVDFVCFLYGVYVAELVGVERGSYV